MTHLTSQSPGHEQALAPRVFHLNRHAIAPRIFHLKLRAIQQALASRVFHRNHHATEQAHAPRVLRLNRRNLAPRVFHRNHHFIGKLLHPVASSANRDQIDAVSGTRTVQCCTLCFGSNPNSVSPDHQGRSDRSTWLVATAMIIPPGLIRLDTYSTQERSKRRRSKSCDEREQAVSGLPEPTPSRPSTWKRLRVIYRKLMLMWTAGHAPHSQQVVSRL